MIPITGAGVNHQRRATTRWSPFGAAGLALTRRILEWLQLRLLAGFRAPTLKYLLVATLSAASTAVLVDRDWLSRTDAAVYDWHMRSWMRPAAPDVVLVAIDDGSLSELGRWPWPRSLHVQLIDQLQTLGARAIAFDLLFANPDPADANLAASLRRSGRVALPVLGEAFRSSGAGVMELLPVPALARAAAALGHIDIALDKDGVGRGAYLWAGSGAARWPALALALLGIAHSGPVQTPEGDPEAEPARQAPYSWVRTGRTLIPFAGPPGHFSRLSYTDVLHGRAKRSQIDGRFVFVGPTATGLGDVVPTPVSSRADPMSGVEFNANLFQALREGVIIRRVPVQWTTGVTASLVFLIVFSFGVVPWGSLVLVASLAVFFLGTGGLMRSTGLWFTPAPAIFGVLVGYMLILALRQRERINLLLRENRPADRVVRSPSEAIITTDVNGIVDYMNPVAEAWTGHKTTRWRRKPLTSVLRLVHPRDHEPIAIEPLASVGGQAEAVLLGPNEQSRSVLLVAMPRRSAPGVPRGVVVALSDLPDRRAREAESRLTSYDGLTGLPNRFLVRDRLARALYRAGRVRRGVAVLVLNVDRFRTINESLGSTAGDAVLRAIADRLRSSVRAADDLARIGGDEFVVILDDLVRDDDAEMLATRVLERFEQPFLVEGRALTIAVTLGFSVFPKDADDAETLLKHADTAMVWARRERRTGLQRYDAGMTDPSSDPLSLEQLLRSSIERDELHLEYQPQVDLANGRLVGVEALLRWRHPEQGVLPPTSFVPLAENLGLIVPIGSWVLEGACRQVAAWQRDGYGSIRVAVNVSAQQFLSEGLTQSVALALDASGINPELLTLEITESLIVREVDRVIETMRELKGMGVGLALDDFGVGYSSLSHLKRLPIDWLKIDRCFVHDLKTDAHDRTICLAIVAMAHSLGRRVIAEGVETFEQLEFLRAKGCDEVQGYLTGRPGTPEDIGKLLRRRALLPV